MQTVVKINPVIFEPLVTYLISKYVDNVLTALETMKLGVRWCGQSKCFIWSKENEDLDRSINQSSEVNTMTEFSKMASSILKCLEFTQDSPASNSDGRMPVLDTSMWVDWQTRELGIPEEIIPSDIKLPVKSGQLKKVVMYRFYRKTIANKTPFNSRSAGPLKDKI